MACLSDELREWLDLAKRQVKPYGKSEIDRFRLLLTAVAALDSPQDPIDTIGAEGCLRLRLVCGSRRPLRPTVSVEVELAKSAATWLNGGTRRTTSLELLPCVNPDKPWPEDEVMLPFRATEPGLVTARSMPEGQSPAKGARSSFFVVPRKESETSQLRAVHDVFVSYAHADRQMIDHVLAEFKRRTISYWVDFEQEVPGRSLISAIEAGLTNSRYVVVCVSAKQLKSGFCRHEYHAALKRAIADDSNRVVPLLLESIPDSEMPPLLSALIAVKFWEEASFGRLLAMLSKRP
jgi:hypothetical protein